MKRLLNFFQLLLGLSFAACPAHAVVISEIHYHPPLGEEGLEFIEISNDSSMPEDISGWAFFEGINYEFPAATILEPRGILVVCADADAVKARYGISNALGDFTGRLDGSGERVTLVNHAGAVVQSIRYRDDGKWPVAPDGTGHSLSLRDVHLDPAEPESWAQSAQLGGTPGLENFPGGTEEVIETAIIDRGAEWRYSKGNAAFSAPADAWLQSGFDDSTWLTGPSGLGYGDGDDATLLPDMQNGYGSIACRKSFDVSSAALTAPGNFFLAVDFDDGFCAYLGGTEIARENRGSPGEVPLSSQLATASREAGSESLHEVPKSAFVAGRNVLAVAGYNLSLDSSDFSLIPRLIQRRVISGGPVVHEETLVGLGEEWRYRKGTGPFSSPASAWRDPGWSDGAWPVGRSGFGFREVGSGAIAYVVPQGLWGNQPFGGALGMDFDVIKDIVISRLGVFDSGSDGLMLPITARLYNRDTGAELASLSFTPGSAGTLVGGSRFKDLPAPVSLGAGFHGTIVAEGYGDAEMNGNQGSGSLGLATESGGGAISFVGGARYGMSPGAFPDVVDGGPPDRYAAGTFEFSVAGTPGGSIQAPPGVSTLLGDMPGAYSSLAMRKRFTVTQETLDSPGDFLLGVDYDDGFCAWMNGVEFARVNCGSAGSEPAWDGEASGAHEGGSEEIFAVPKALLADGDNVLAIAGFNAALENPDFELTARFYKQWVEEAPSAMGGITFNELYRGASPGGGWVELHNSGAAPADLSGYFITDNPDRPDPHRLPQGTTLAAGGFLVVTEGSSGLGLSAARVQLFLLSPDGLAAAASTFDRAPPPGVAAGAYSECRFPDGGALDWVSEEPTRGRANEVDALEDIVLSEIMYHPPEDRSGEFVELYNRGTSAVDLSGFRFDKGIQFTIPAGISLAPGAYLAITNDPAFLAHHHGVIALGPYQGNLSDAGEMLRLVDRRGNPADQVRYHDGGRWSHWADGEGSSLELIDPRQDNSFASAWEASDDAEKTEWEELSFQVPSYKVAAESELHVYLIDRGICLIDDVSVRRSGGANLIPNAGFESSTSPWLIGGTHVYSERITSDSASGSACLRLVATGRGDTLVNRIETDTSPAMTAGAYDVSLRARWQRGTSLMVVHGEYTQGPYRTTPCITCGGTAPNWSGNSLHAALRMSVPFALGTPGAENSARRKLRQETGSDNLGPVIAGVEHRPPSPEAGAPAGVTARVSDADGVASVEVLYRTGSAAGPFQSAPLLDDGLHGDGAAGDGLYGGQLPGQPSLTKVVFYVEATDALGAARTFPVAAPDETCLYQVQGSLTSRLDAYRIVLDNARTTELQTRQLHSNDLVEGAFVFENEKAYYEIGTRYRGSPWGRPSRSSYAVRFAEDDRFHGKRAEFNLNASGGSLAESAGLFLTGRNALPGKPSPAMDYRFVQAWLNGSALGTAGDMEAVEGDFLDRWFGDGSEGPLLKASGRFVFTDSGGLIGQTGWEGASLIYRGESPENYRNYFYHSMEQTRDDWEPLVRLVRLLDSSQTPDAALGEQVEGLIDLEGFFQVLSTRLLLGDGDAWGVNNGHNGYMAYDSHTGLWYILSFDLEASFGIGSPALFGSLDPGVSRLLSHPHTKRAYLRVLSRYEEGYWSAIRAGPWLDAVQRATGAGVQGIKDWIASGAARIRSTVDPLEQTTFRIVTNSGKEIQTTERSVVLEGEAPIQVSSILWRVNGTGEHKVLEPAWTTTVRWKAEFLLEEDRNQLEFLGVDSKGNVLAVTGILVTTSAPARLAVTGWFPDAGPSAGGTSVTYIGEGFAQGLRIFFGGAEAPQVSVKSAGVVEATTPPAPLPLPSGGRVDVELVLGNLRLRVPEGFRYTLEGGFIRGDAGGDGAVDLSDVLKVVLGLFVPAQVSLPCEKSADFDDSGTLNILDAIGLLNYLFLRGPPPIQPFPGCGLDATPDPLGCEGFTLCE